MSELKYFLFIGPISSYYETNLTPRTYAIQCDAFRALHLTYRGD